MRCAFRCHYAMRAMPAPPPCHDANTMPCFIRTPITAAAAVPRYATTRYASFIAVSPDYVTFRYFDADVTIIAAMMLLFFAILCHMRDARTLMALLMMLTARCIYAQPCFAFAPRQSCRHFDVMPSCRCFSAMPDADAVTQRTHVAAARRMPACRPRRC